MLDIPIAAKPRPYRRAARVWEQLRRHPSADDGTYHRLADRFSREGRCDEAIQVCRLWITQHPQSVQAHFDLAHLLFTRQDFTGALEPYRWLTQRRPDQAHCWNRLGLCEFQLGRYPEAVYAFQMAVALCPKEADLHERWAQALFRGDRLTAAEACMHRAIQLQPDRPAYHLFLGDILRAENRVHEALAAYRHALNLEPGHPAARAGLCHMLLLTGQYAEAWETHTWWHVAGTETPVRRPARARPWDGMSYGGQHLLLRWEGRIGDNIQCWRYLPAVKALGGTVVIEVPSEVQGLLQRYPDIDCMVVPGREPPLACDYEVCTLELPRIFHTTAEAVPRYEPYLRVPGRRVRLWETPCATQDFKVGIAWAGDPDHVDAHQCTCPLSCLDGLTRIPHVRLFGLQKRAAADLSGCAGMTDLGHEWADFADTAAVLHHMDLVISTDSAVLHLAGAMGKPTWALLPFAPDWRWHLDRRDNPWYPTMRLFRQTQRGDWQGVLQRVNEALRALV
jgi:cytochrome c-type biogenesis protein CcmH/NrfG